MWKGLFEVEVSGVEQDLIPYVGQVVLPKVPVKRWIIEPYVHSLLGGPGEGMWPPTNNGEIVQVSMMTWGVGMVINGGRCPEIFL